VVALVRECEGAKQLFVGNLGDSRVVLARRDLGQSGPLSAVQISVDHRADAQQETDRILSVGGFIADSRLFGVLVPSRSIGDFAYKFDARGALSPIPETHTLEIKTGEDQFLLLGTDGFFEVVSNEKAVTLAQEALIQGKGTTGACSLLAQTARDLGTKDDVTVVIALL